MESVESRLKSEVNNLSEQFDKAIAMLKSEHETELTKYKQKLQDMSAMHTTEIQQVRENHNRIIDEIKYEYSTMIDNLKQVKQTENSLIDNASAYTQKLDSSLEALGVNSSILNEIRGKVQSEYGILTKAREESLKAKEEEIRMMRVALEKARESADAERTELMTLVRNLELKLVEQIQNTKEERWTLKQSASVLMARTAAFDREMEFARSTLEREREQLQTFKEQLLVEQNNQILQITEEKLRISAEKSKLETAAKLTQNFDAERNKVEIEAAIQVAKEAAERADHERKQLHGKHAEVESLKRSLVDQQHQLSLKEQQLKQLMLKADQRAKDGEQALIDAKLLEENCNARLRDIQTQLMSLRNQEKKLAQEKVMLLREQTNIKRTKRCSLCSNGNAVDGGNILMDTAEQDFSPRMFAITDPDIVRLRYEINEELLPIPIPSEENDQTK
uniref:Fas-binding factor 1 C-terminal domain-containing protein n=1 Tax=Photinus pyralis TaxID=7054 RepID=A0A1Y1MZU4_PHOPY